MSLRAWRTIGSRSSRSPSAGSSGFRRSSRTGARSEEHTSELQSQSNLVCRLLLEKKKKHMSQSLLSQNPPSSSSSPYLHTACHPPRSYPASTTLLSLHNTHSTALF